MRHPNSYLPKYNIQSETDGESIPLTQSNDAILTNNGVGSRQRILMKNGVDIGPHQIVQSDEDDVPAYGFPSQKRRNRIEQSDFGLNKGGKDLLKKKTVNVCGLEGRICGGSGAFEDLF